METRAQDEHWLAGADFKLPIVRAVTFVGPGGTWDVRYAMKDLDGTVKIEFADGAMATFTGKRLREVAEAEGL